MNAHLQAWGVDFLGTGSLSNDSSLFAVYREGNGPDNAQDVSEKTHSKIVPFSANQTPYIVYGLPSEASSINDLDGDNVDDFIVLLRDDLTIDDYLQVRCYQTWSNNSMEIHFSLRSCTKLFVSDLDQEGTYDFIAGKIDQNTFECQVLMNTIELNTGTDYVTANSDTQLFTIQEKIKNVILLKGKEGQKLLCIYGEKTYAIYVYSTETNQFTFVEYNPLSSIKKIQKNDSNTFALREYLAQITKSDIKKIFPIQPTQDYFISDYNMVVFYSDNTIDFVQETPQNGLTQFKRVAIQPPPKEVFNNYTLDEVYIPSHFENRIAIWYQSTINSSGRMIFFQVTEEDDHISLSQEPTTEIATLSLSHKPKLFVYLPSYIQNNQVNIGHDGQWRGAHHSYNVSSFDQAWISTSYDSNP